MESSLDILYSAVTVNISATTSVVIDGLIKFRWSRVFRWSFFITWSWGHTVLYPRTSNHYIEVVGLMSGTCYVFGVRAYTSVTYSPGEFSLIQGNTTSYEGCNS